MWMHIFHTAENVLGIFKVDTKQWGQRAGVLPPFYYNDSKSLYRKSEEICYGNKTRTGQFGILTFFMSFRHLASQWEKGTPKKFVLLPSHLPSSSSISHSHSHLMLLMMWLLAPPPLLQHTCLWRMHALLFTIKWRHPCHEWWWWRWHIIAAKMIYLPGSDFVLILDWPVPCLWLQYLFVF